MLISRVIWPLLDKPGQFGALPVLSPPKTRCTPGPRELRLRCSGHCSVPATWQLLEGSDHFQGLATWPPLPPHPSHTRLRSGGLTSFRLRVGPTFLWRNHLLRQPRSPSSVQAFLHPGFSWHISPSRGAALAPGRHFSSLPCPDRERAARGQDVGTYLYPQASPTVACGAESLRTATALLPRTWSSHNES